MYLDKDQALIPWHSFYHLAATLVTVLNSSNFFLIHNDCESVMSISTDLVNPVMRKQGKSLENVFMAVILNKRWTVSLQQTMLYH